MGALRDQRSEHASKPTALTPVIDFPVVDERVSEKLVEALGVSPIIADVLVSRGIRTPQEASDFLYGEVEVDQSQLGDLSQAVSILSQARELDLTIAIHGDYDCDGISSTALLTRGLRALGLKVFPRVPERSDGYGLSLQAVEELAATGAKVLISVDCGITAVAEVRHAKSLGMEAIVIDHHRLPLDGVLPDAAIVHPAITDPSALPMCATAVAAEVIRALASSLGVDDPDAGLAELSALATVTDVMPLTGANRTIVKRGLEAMRTTNVLGLGSLLDSAGVDRSALSARDLGWSLGPRVNAAGRVRAAGAALELLTTEDAARADQLASELEAANAERRLSQQEVRIAAEMQIVEVPKAAAWVVAGERWHPGVVGIVAGSLAGSGYRPSIAIAIDGEMATGSVRSVPGYDVAAAVDACSHLLERHGGHAAAAGLTIRADRIDQFREEFVKVVDETLPLALRRPHATVDAVASPSEITLSLAEELEMFEPVGEGNPEVSLGVRSATLERPSRMGDGKHARFSVVVGDSSAEGVAFNARERISVQWGQACDVVGVLEVNRWKGREEPRFRVTRAAHSELKPIELVVGEDAWVERAFRDTNQDPDTGSHALIRSNRRESATMRSGISTLTRLCSGGQSVLAIVADVPRRLPGLQRVVGGFTLCDWSTFERSPELAERFEDVVLLDPPARPSLLELARSAGEGWLHRAWGGAEVRFALKVHENDTDIERQLRPFFKDLRAAAELGTADERLAAIQGPGRHPRSSVAVGWMLAVLREIGVAEVNQDGIEITLGDVRGELDTSVSWRRVNSRLEEGRSFLLSLMQAS